MEIVFVGQCEVFVCLGFGHFNYFICLFFSLAAKLIGARTGRQFFKNVDCSDRIGLLTCRINSICSPAKGGTGCYRF